MEKLIADFPLQLKEALGIARNQKLNSNFKAANVLISGLGGSGIGGTIVSQLLASACRVPVTVNKDYFIPAFCGSQTLAIFSSYSGNTEETLQALEQAHQTGAHIVCITSGGKLRELAEARGYDLVVIPGGYPPRAAFGFSSVQLLFIFSGFGLINTDVDSILVNSIQLLDSQSDNIKREALALAQNLAGKTPVLYSDATYEGVAVRWRQQINENAKMLCWHHAIPEMNHNELVGWRENREDLAVVILRNKADFDRTQQRIALNKEIISRYCQNIYEVWSEGETPIERAYYLIHLGDWVSTYLADIKKIDATEVKVIDFLKGELAKR